MEGLPGSIYTDSGSYIEQKKSLPISRKCDEGNKCINDICKGQKPKGK